MPKVTERGGVDGISSFHSVHHLKRIHHNGTPVYAATHLSADLQRCEATPIHASRGQFIWLDLYFSVWLLSRDKVTLPSYIVNAE